MKHGDFTKLAKNYVYRTGYSKRALGVIGNYIGCYRDNFVVADVGAGTGKLTDNLDQLGLCGFAVEPNEAMRSEGMKLMANRPSFSWQAGSAEETGLETSCADWLLMASSFHWTDAPVALAEFRRVLKPGGFLTVLWNPRDLGQSALHQKIEHGIYEIAPEIKRVSSGSSKYTQGIEQTLTRDALFGHLFFVEAPHEAVMTPERYLGAWRSVNDIQVQAGEEKFAEIMKMIESQISSLDKIVVPYKTRAWTVQALP